MPNLFKKSVKTESEIEKSSPQKSNISESETNKNHVDSKARITFSYGSTWELEEKSLADYPGLVQRINLQNIVSGIRAGSVNIFIAPKGTSGSQIINIYIDAMAKAGYSLGPIPTGADSSKLFVLTGTNKDEFDISFRLKEFDDYIVLISLISPTKIKDPLYWNITRNMLDQVANSMMSYKVGQ